MFVGEIYQEEVFCTDMIPDEQSVCTTNSTNIFQMHNMLDSDGGVSIVMGTPESNHVTEDNNIEDIGENRKKKISRKNDTRQYRQYRKKNRNQGLGYTTNKGKQVLARTSESLSNCRNNCKAKVDDNLRTQLFNLYWSMNDYNRRRAYLSSLITSSNKKVVRKRRDTPEKQKNREKVFHYAIPNDGTNILVCKGCFLKIFGEKKGFLTNICNNSLTSPANTCSPDKRGNAQPKNKRSTYDVKMVKDHLNKLPVYESHYCRQETNKKYLPPYFTLQRAYADYVKTVDKPVSRTLYEKYFKASNLKVKNPKKDTCANCDKFKIKLANNIQIAEKEILLEERNHHQNDAEEAYQTKRNDISSNSNEKCTISFDLQQCLPTPSLESSVAFYKRQLWTYNLTVHNSANSKASCYIWYESIAKRGANEISSCIYHYLNNLSKEVSHIVMYSDCCPGQNKNGINMAMCLYFLEIQNTIKTIDHKFMVPGHSRMECDSDHARIEKARKKYPSTINHPHDWAQLIRFAGKDKFCVLEMDQTKFFDFNTLLKKKYNIKKKK